MSKTLTATVVEIDTDSFLAAAFPKDEAEQSRLDEERYQRFSAKLAKCMAELDANPL